MADHVNLGVYLTTCIPSYTLLVVLKNIGNKDAIKNRVCFLIIC